MEMDDVFGNGVSVDGDVVVMVDEVCRLYLSCLRDMLSDGDVGVKDLVNLGKVLLPLLEGRMVSSSSSGGGVVRGGGGVDLLKVINGGAGDV